jgi:hypothetical protein
MTRNIVWRSMVGLAALATLSACGGGGGGDDSPASFTVSANVSGLTGTGLMLRNNGGNDLAVSSNGIVTFSNSVASGANYNVTVATQPSAQTCLVTNGAGTVANANVSNVAVNCTSNGPAAPVVTLSSDTKRHTLQWAPAAGAGFYRVYKTRSTDTDFQLISGDLLAQTFDNDPVAVHLEDWVHLRYRVDACNATSCTSSLPNVPASHLPLTGYFKAHDSFANEFFGRATAISADGSTVAIGAHGKHNDSDSSGGVHVFVRDLHTWRQQVYLKQTPSSFFGFFGLAVSLSDDGNTLAVGAPKPSVSTFNRPGSVYIFSRDAAGNWTLQANLQASNSTNNDVFGTAVAISGDGNTVVVGAPQEDSSATGVSATAANDTNALESGAAYIFTRAAGVWTQQAYVKASNTGAADGFGSRVAINTSGDTFVIGAPGEDSNATGINGDQNNNLMVNTGAAYVFQRSSNTWVQEAYVKSPFPDPDGGAPGYEMGVALALSGDGNTLGVTSILEASNARGLGGDPTNMAMPSSGAAYVYVRDSGTWSHQAYVKASNTGANDQFGKSVDFSSDGNIMTIGAPGESSRATGVGGDQVDDGAANSGAVYVFRRTGSSWTQVSYVHAHQPDPEDQFGASVSLSGDGTAMVVGAPNEDGGGNGFNPVEDETESSAGAAYIF